MDRPLITSALSAPLVSPCALPDLSAAGLAAPYTLLLESPLHHPLGRWSLLARRPWQVAVVRGTAVEVWTDHGCTRIDGQPWAILAALAAQWRQQSHPQHPCPGGVLGYLGFELGQPWLTQRPNPGGLPDAVLAWYREIIAWQPGADHAWRGTAPHAPTSSVAPDLGLPPLLPAPAASLDQAGFVAGVARVLDYIAAGDIYQANLTFNCRAHSTRPPWEVYQRLRTRTAAPFGAFLSLPGAAVLSASPERFLHCDAAGRVETRPIKGTRPRGATRAEDARMAAELHASPKERAENLMITDLLRNDIGQVCTIGSVAVPTLWELVTLPTVHHLVSTVTGRLAARYSRWDLLRACWPGGSISGAPKRRALEIIAGLEPEQRGIYCGTIGYWSFDGAMDTSIVIRTLVARDGHWSWGVGCGIVADSDPVAEYAEALLKGAALQAAIADAAPGLHNHPFSV